MGLFGKAAGAAARGTGKSVAKSYQKNHPYRCPKGGKHQEKVHRGKGGHTQTYCGKCGEITNKRR